MFPKISADKEFIEKTGPIRIGMIYARVSINSTTQELQKLISDACDKIAGSYKLEEVNKIENIANTRNAYKKLGNDPNRYRPSADALIRRIVKGMGIYRINNVVDVLNLISITDGYSISGFNPSRIDGPVSLGTGRTGEPYQGIGRGNLNISNLPVMRDKIGAFGTPTSDSERTMIGPDTDEILFAFYDFGNNPNLKGSMENCLELLKIYCQAKEYSMEILNFT